MKLSESSAKKMAGGLYNHPARKEKKIPSASKTAPRNFPSSFPAGLRSELLPQRLIHAVNLHVKIRAFGSNLVSAEQKPVRTMPVFSSIRAETLSFL